MSEVTEVEVMNGYNKPADRSKGRGWRESKDPSLGVAPHHQEAAKYGQSSHIIEAARRTQNYAPVRDDSARWGPGGQGGVLAETGTSYRTDVLHAEANVIELGTISIGIMDNTEIEAWGKGEIDKESFGRVMNDVDVVVQDMDQIFDEAIAVAQKTEGEAIIEPEMERVWKNFDNADRKDADRMFRTWNNHLDKR